MESVPEQRQGVLTTVQGRRALVQITEALTSELLPTLLDGVANVLAEGATEITVDLVRQKSLSSAALEVLLDCGDLASQRSGRVRIANPSALIRETLYITGIDHRITVVNDSESEGAGGDRQRLGDILLARGLVDSDQLEVALEEQRTTGKRLGEVLIEREWVSDADVLAALSQQLAVPEANLKPGLYDPEISTVVDRRTLQRLRVYPLFKVRGELTLATVNAQNVPLLREMEALTGCRVRPVMCPQASIMTAIDETSSDASLGAELLAEVDEDFEVVEGLPQDLDAVDDMAAGSPVINLVNSLIQRAVRDGASDVHIEPARDKCRVRFRIDGILYEVMALRTELLPAVVSRLKVMANLDIAERRMPQDGRIQVVTQGRTVDLRFSSLPGLFGEKVVLRVLDRNQAILDVTKLGMSDANLASYRSLLSAGYGLILVTGPTGSGKTTSLYAALNSLNSLERNIVTIEDPVEYQLDIINQNEVRGRIGLSFAKLLKHVLRQDPDIIMVGEIRERETAEIAVQAALTGHLVLSTLHTNDSIGAITRMIDMGVEPYLLSSALIGVVGQRLLRRICPSCRTSFLAPADVLERFGWDRNENLQLAQGRGCSECYDSGYRGRAAIHELLPASDELQRLIMSNPSRDRLNEYLREHDVATLFDDGLDRVRNQVTTLEEVARVVNG